MIRDEEIQRLINYAKGLGLTVSFSSKKEECSAAWYIDNSGIVIYKNKNKTKIETVLSIIHELGHAKHNIWEQNRELDKKFEESLDKVEKAEEDGEESQRKHRKVILDSEVHGVKYWDEIYKDTDMKFPKWKLDMAKEHDVWVYEIYYETGKDPSSDERKRKRKELTLKYKGDKND